MARPKWRDATFWRAALEVTAALAFIMFCVVAAWDLVEGRVGDPVTVVAPPPPPPPRPEPPLPAEPISLGGEAVLGDPAAKVVLVLYSEFKCPYCAAFARDTMPALKEKFIDTGAVSLIFRHFPLDQLHPFARAAAETGWCANQQGKFWTLHDRMFAVQRQLDEDVLSKELVAAGLDLARLESCRTAGAAQRVQEDVASGSRLGVGGTPTVFVGRRLDGDRVQLLERIVGNQPVLLGREFGPAADPGQAQFRSRADLVVLDVSVQDSRRQPVQGLTRSDFTVIERGVPRSIESFVEVRVQPPEAMKAGWQGTIPADVAANDISDRRLIVIALDDGGGAPAYGQKVREIGHRLIDQMGQSDLGAVAYLLDGRRAQDFTLDRALLRAAVNRYGRGAGYYPLRTLKNVVDQLAAVPGRRKTVYFVSGGYNLDFSKLPPSIDVHDREAQGEMRYLLSQLQDVFLAAQRANVNIYAIDPSGLTVGDGKDIDPQRNARDFLHILANETGARAVTSRNDPEAAVEELFQENGTYYLLGIPPVEPLDRKFRRLQVRVNRPNVTVRARTGYYADPPAPPVKAATTLGGTIPQTDLPMRLSVVPVGLGGKSAVGLFAIGLEVPADAPGPAETVTAEIGVFDQNGRSIGLARPQLSLAVAPGRRQAVVYDLLSRIDVRPGRYIVRASAHARERNLKGSVFGDIEVPDYANARLSLSGPILEAAPAPLAAPRDVATALVPLVPSTTRTYDRTRAVQGWLRVHQGGRDAPGAVEIRITLTNLQELIVLDQKATIDSTAFGAARQADHRFTVPIAELAPGEYLLTVTADAGSGAKAERFVRFTVR